MKVKVACQTNPDLWYSDNEDDKTKAKNVCFSCPVQAECLATAIEYREKHGIWGGKDFSGIRLPKLQNIYCRKGKHKLPEVRENNRCPECRRETQHAWEVKQAREQTPWYLNKVAKKREADQASKNKIGGTCKAGHRLDTEKDYFIRTKPSYAIVCKKCIHKVVDPTGLGDQNSGSRNHG